MSKIIAVFGHSRRAPDRARRGRLSGPRHRGERRAIAPSAFPTRRTRCRSSIRCSAERVERLADMQTGARRSAAGCCRRCRTSNVWLPYLGDTLDAGMATLFAFEIIEACKYLIGPNPVNGIWLGAASDVIIRERGIEFVDGSAPGFAAVVGAAPTIEDAVRIARELQEKNLYVFMAGHTNGVSFAEQLQRGRRAVWAGRRAWCPSAKTSRRPSTRSASPTVSRSASAACSRAITRAI